MKIIPNPTGGLRMQKAVRGITLGVFLVMAATASVHASDRDDRGRGDRDWRAHEGRSHGYEPGVVYAPPVVYTAPQYEEPGFNLVVPLNFR
jgi:hypothetical protein